MIHQGLVSGHGHKAFGTFDLLNACISAIARRGGGGVVLSFYYLKTSSTGSKLRLGLALLGSLLLGFLSAITF